MLFLYMDLLHTDAENDCFRILYDRYHQLLFRIARQILPDDYLAEDAVQNAYLTALRHLGDFEDPASPASRNLLITITRSRAVDLWRSHRASFAEEFSSEPSDDEDLLENLLVQEDIRLVTCGIRQLSPEDRAVIEGFYLHELPMKKIARLTGTTEKNISVRLTRARRRLAKILIKLREEPV